MEHYFTESILMGGVTRKSTTEVKTATKATTKTATTTIVALEGEAT